MNLVTVGLLRRRKEEKSWAECEPLLMRSQKTFLQTVSWRLGSWVCRKLGRKRGAD